ncbi:MAG: acyltransferase [Coriobacteriales bacterium]
MPKTRKSNIELLRILCMLLICLHHFCVHGPWSDVSVANALTLDVLSMGGKIGVDCFVLISGYFLIASCARLRSLLRLELETVFYSVVILAVVLATGFKEVGRLGIIGAILPTSTSEYWFITAYVGMYVLSPLLNRALAGLDERRYRLVLAVGFVMLSAIHTLLIVWGNPFASDVVWFAYLYAVGGYVRLYGGGVALPKKGASTWLNPVLLVERMQPVTCLVVLPVFLALTAWMGCSLEGAFPAFRLSGTSFMGMDTAFCLWISIALFMLFERLDLRPIPVINTLAGSVFGVYLIHDNPYVRAWLWPHFSWAGSLGVPALVGCALLAAIAVFVACSAIDLVRANLIERPVMRVLDKRLAGTYERVDECIRGFLR